MQRVQDKLSSVHVSLSPTENRIQDFFVHPHTHNNHLELRNKDRKRLCSLHSLFFPLPLFHEAQLCLASSGPVDRASHLPDL